MTGLPYSDPAERRRVARESARRRRSRERASASTPSRQPVDPIRLARQHGTPGALPARDPATSAVDVAELLAEAMEQVRRDEHAGTMAKARTLAYVAGMWLRAHELGELTQEVEELRRRLDQMDGHRGLGIVR